MSSANGCASFAANSYCTHLVHTSIDVAFDLYHSLPLKCPYPKSRLLDGSKGAAQNGFVWTYVVRTCLIFRKVYFIESRTNLRFGAIAMAIQSIASAQMHLSRDGSIKSVFGV